MKCPECSNRFSKYANHEYTLQGLAHHKKYSHTNISESKKSALRRQNKKNGDKN